LSDTDRKRFDIERKLISNGGGSVIGGVTSMDARKRDLKAEKKGNA